MLSDSSIAFLERLLDTPGPSGFEGAPARVWRDEASSFTSVRADAVGNSLATVQGTGGGPTILLAGHIDEIGVIITHIDDEGFAYIDGIGGWDPQVLVAQRIRFLGRNGDVIGVVGKKPIHLMKQEDRDKASKMTDLWVDIGAANKGEAMERIEVGDPGVIDSHVVRMPNDRIVSRSIDDRIGAFVVLEALRRYASSPGAATVVAAATAHHKALLRFLAGNYGGIPPLLDRHESAEGVRSDFHKRLTLNHTQHGGTGTGAKHVTRIQFVTFS